MTDIVSKSTRSAMMSGIRHKNTKPELLVRTQLFARGYRYRLHAGHLPGKPDIIFPKYKAVVFIHGCFWHCHDCHLFKWPQSRQEFWQQKLSSNKERDLRHQLELRSGGWRVAVIHECALKGKTRIELSCLLDRIESWFQSSDDFLEISGIF